MASQCVFIALLFSASDMENTTYVCVHRIFLKHPEDDKCWLTSNKHSDHK